MIKRLNSSGETIVEVLIAILVLSAALSGAFAISNKSQKTIQANQERYQAQLIANEQADLIRINMANATSNALMNGYITGATNFCITVTSTSSGAPVPNTTDCSRPSGSIAYTITIIPKSNVLPASVKESFIVKVEWDSLVNSGQDNVQVFYGT